MKLHPRVTPAAVDLVKRFEGFRPRAARTPEGRFTIGYGHLLSPRDSADEADISEGEAEFLLKHDLAVTAEAVEDALLAPVNDNQFAALLSFAFNIGVENFRGSSALRRLNEGAYLQAAAALELWRRADFDGEALVVDQLVRRRAVEKALFLAPPEGFMPLPSSVLRPSFDHSVIGAAVAWAAARERTAVGRLALEGPEAAPGLAIPPGREGEPAPSAAIAAADALAVRLSRILPEDATLAHEEDGAHSLAASQPPPLTLEAEPELEARETAAPSSAATNFTGAPAVAGPFPSAFGLDVKRDDSGFDLPPPPVARAIDAEPSDFPAAASDAEGAPAAEPPPFVAASAGSEASDSVSPWRRRPAGRAGAEVTPFFPLEPAAPSLFDAGRSEPAASASEDVFGASAEQAAQPAAPGAPSDALPVPLFERPLFFQVLGLMGVALFAGSIFCMMNRASFSCLLIGVLGVLTMAPAAAFFLFRFLGHPVSPGSHEHADLATAMRTETPAEAPAIPVGADAQEGESRFDRAWR